MQPKPQGTGATGRRRRRRAKRRETGRRTWRRRNGASRLASETRPPRGWCAARRGLSLCPVSGARSQSCRGGSALFVYCRARAEDITCQIRLRINSSSNPACLASFAALRTTAASRLGSVTGMPRPAFTSPTSLTRSRRRRTTAINSRSQSVICRRSPSSRSRRADRSSDTDVSVHVPVVLRCAAEADNREHGDVDE